ncbi:hypothetical protein BDR05DRAFT_966437, partial [Suillus weaverae]
MFDQSQIRSCEDISFAYASVVIHTSMTTAGYNHRLQPQARLGQLSPFSNINIDVLHTLSFASLISFLQPSQPNVPPTTVICALPSHAEASNGRATGSNSQGPGRISGVKKQLDIPNLDVIFYSILYIGLTFANISGKTSMLM